jgi:hypothetical protein
MENQNQRDDVRRLGSRIDLTTATKWTRNYRQRHPGETISHLFGRDVIDRILAQPDCMGIRIYYANSKPLSVIQRLILLLVNFLTNAFDIVGEKHLILVGTDSFHKDQIPKIINYSKQAFTEPEAQLRNLNTSDEDNYMLAEQAVPCPGTTGCPMNELTS